MSTHPASATSRFQYHVYGVVISSDVPLSLPDPGGTGLASIECYSAPASVFVEARSNAQSLDAWHRSALLPDGSTYLGWDTVGEFLTSPDGRRVACRRADASNWESFQVYMLGQALSAALVKQGIEPLHATTVVADGEAIAFLGDSAHGKSSLAACFLEAGYRLLTDDLLVLQHTRTGVLAHPGPARIKLFPGVARRFLGCREQQPRMNAGTDKWILPLADGQRSPVPVPLRAFYAVTPPRDACRRADVSIEPLGAREAFLRLLRASFNRRLVEPSRLARQFEAMTMIAGRIQVHRLSYPRSIDRLVDVRDEILAHIAPTAAAVHRS